MPDGAVLANILSLSLIPPSELKRMREKTIVYTNKRGLMNVWYKNGTA
jgi:hypothetical protein